MSAEPTDSGMDCLPTDAPKADQAKLTALTNEANLEYSLKKYPEAAELYSEAAELQVTLNGEMALENAELLFLYGRCLYKVAISKSDVLGGQVASEKPKVKSEGSSGAAVPSAIQKLSEDVVEAAVEAKDTPKTAGIKQEPSIENKPFFEITGDDNWDTDSEGDEAGDAQAEAVEEEDDFATAYEILDVARVLLTKKIAALEGGGEQPEVNGKGKAKVAEPFLSPSLRHLKDRLADTHDLQGEISLENERFDDAIKDITAALSLWHTLHPKAAGIIAEGHFKLSLAYEFAANVGAGEEEAEVKDEDKSKEEPSEAKVKLSSEEIERLRSSAISEMEIAIESCRLRLAKEKDDLKSLDGKEAKEKEKSMEEVKEIIGEMEQRLSELRYPAVAEENPLAAVLSGMLGESPAQAKARVEEASKNANDLSGLVKHKKRKAPDSQPVSGTFTEAGSSQNGEKKRMRIDESGNLR